MKTQVAEVAAKIQAREVTGILPYESDEQMDKLITLRDQLIQDRLDRKWNDAGRPVIPTVK